MAKKLAKEGLEGNKVKRPDPRSGQQKKDGEKESEDDG